MDSFQKGLKPLSLVVESGSDVLDSLVVRIILFEGLDLSFKVSRLLGRTDSSVNVEFLLFFVSGNPELLLDVGDVVYSFSTFSSISQSSNSNLS